ncbi:HSP20-like chaperone [Phyllosticta citribraziliensis]|uniref:HSP20-like chaperone n=1 Tax=Phyllosticta citribraziliensis TaxID=989973 RepID=A0ABR1LI43_9PEZI
MPSIRYVNQTAPFWDFVANLENQGTTHPFFTSRSGDNQNTSDDERPWGPWGARFHPFMGPGCPTGWARGPHPPSPPRAPHGPGHHHHPPPPPPPPPHGFPHPPPPPPHPEGFSADVKGDQDRAGSPTPENDGPAPPYAEAESSSAPYGHHVHPHQRGHGRRGGRRGPWGRASWAGAPFDLSGFSDLFQRQLFGEQGDGERDAMQGEFKPEADVFDTETAYVIHLSIPGAKKEDVGLSWDAEKSEISVSGVVHRPGDEELLKTLALNERKVGAFDRKIRLGSRANPAQVDSDAITAKLEDGILKVEVPKLDKDYVEIKKVDIL